MSLNQSVKDVAELFITAKSGTPQKALNDSVVEALKLYIVDKGGTVVNNSINDLVNQATAYYFSENSISPAPRGNDAIFKATELYLTSKAQYVPASLNERLLLSSNYIKINGVAAPPSYPLTWSETLKATDVALSNSNMTATKINAARVVSGLANGYFDQAVSGDILVYWQQQVATPSGSPITVVGVAGEFFDYLWLGGHNTLGNDQGGTAVGAAVGQSLGWHHADGAIYRKGSNVTTGAPAAITRGDWIEVALRLTAGRREIFFRKVGGVGNDARWNGTGNTTADPLVSGTGLALPTELSGKVYPAYSVYGNGLPDVVLANFGATAFQGTTFTALAVGGYATASSKAIGMSAPPLTVNVSNDAQLAIALGNSSSGQTIRLAPGTYAQIGITNRTFPGLGITITSDIPGSRAVINGVEWSNVKNITLKGVNTLKGTRAVNQASLIVLGGSDNVTFDDVIVRDTSHSNVAATWKADALAAYTTWDALPPGAAKDAARVAMDAVVGAGGASFVSSNNITVKNCNFQYLGGCLVIQDISGFLFDNNVVQNSFGDGLQFKELRNGTITNNFFSLHYNLPGDHTDAIQGVTSGALIASENLVISNNTIIRGVGGTDFQGIFLGNEDSVYHKNITITYNTLTGTQFSGISVGEGENITISNNTVQAYNDSPTNIYYNQWIGTNYILDNVAYVQDYAPGTPSVGMTITGNTTPPAPGPPPT